MKVKVQTLDAGKGGDIELKDEIFAVEPRADILHRVVTWQLVNRRARSLTARGPSYFGGGGKAALSLTRESGTLAGTRAQTNNNRSLSAALSLS